MYRRFIAAAVPVRILVVAALLAAGLARAELVLDGVPPPDAALAARLAPYLEVRGATFQDFLPDGAMLVRTRFGDTEQLHRVAAPLGAREQLTFLGSAVGAATVPRGAAPAAIAFEQGAGGGADVQVRAYRFADRRIRTLSDGRARHGGAAWAHDGRRVAFHGNGRDLVSDDVYVADASLDAPARLLVTGQRRLWRVLDWSADDARLLLLDATDGPDAGLFVADVASGAVKALPVQAGENGRRTSSAALRSARFSADGRGVWAVAEIDGAEFARLGLVDLADGRWRAHGEEMSAQIEEIAVGPDGRYLALLANASGASRITVVDLGMRSELVASRLPPGLVRGLRFDPEGKRLGMTIESPQSPPDAYSWDVERDLVVRWTRSETGPLDGARFVAAETLRFPGWDRVDGQLRQIPALIYRPATPGPHPVLIQVDGGAGGGQSRADFDALRQFLVTELGYTVIAANVRGSGGYGRSWAALGAGALGQDAVREIGALLVWISAQRDLDAKRVAILGGPRGGELALAALAAYGDRIQRGVDLGGQGAASHATASMRRAANGTTALGGIAAVRRPVLVVRGYEERSGPPTVPLLDAGTIALALRRNGREVWMVDARGDSAGYQRRSARDPMLRVVASFLAQPGQ